MGNLTQATYVAVRKVAFRETANFKEQGEIRTVRAWVITRRTFHSCFVLGS